MVEGSQTHFTEESSEVLDTHMHEVEELGAKVDAQEMPTLQLQGIICEEPNLEVPCAHLIEETIELPDIHMDVPGFHMQEEVGIVAKEAVQEVVGELTGSMVDEPHTYPIMEIAGQPKAHRQKVAHMVPNLAMAVPETHMQDMSSMVPQCASPGSEHARCHGR